MLLVWVLIVLERAKSCILPNGNFREFFPWRGEFCVFKTGIPGGPATDGVAYFFLQKPTFLLIVLCKVLTFFSYRLVTPVHTSTTPTFRHRLSSVLTKFSRNIFFHSGVTPWMVSRGEVSQWRYGWMYAIGLYYDHGHGASRRIKSRKLKVKSSHEVVT